MIHTHFKSQRKQLFILDKSCLWITYCKRVCLIHIHAQSYINLGWGIFRKWKLLLRKWSKTFFNIEDEEIHIYVFPMLIHNSSMKWDLSIFEYNYYNVVYLYDTPSYCYTSKIHRWLYLSCVSTHISPFTKNAETTVQQKSDIQLSEIT